MEIVVALVGALGVIIAALVTRGITQKQNQLEINGIEKAVRDVGKADSGRIKFVAPYYIQRVERYDKISCDGDEIDTYRYIGVKAYQSFDNLRIPFIVGVEGPDAVFHEPTVKELPGSSLTVTLDKVEKFTIPNLNQSYIKGFIVINGHFSPETNPVSFERIVNCDRIYCMTKEEAVETYQHSDWKQEYSIVEANVPTDELVLTIEFPECMKEMNPGPSPLVFIGDSEIVHQGETKRIISKFQFKDRIAQLQVESPILGLRYAITWMPPSNN
ncbi:MAG: hypothetical protein KOO63_04315 [Bacteroidales bacterium]|nr:hypothetical protein [Candidatus Latescibacterota bacterium]